MLPLPTATGLALLDTALAAGHPVSLPALLDAAALRAQASAGVLPAIMRGLVRVPAIRTDLSGPPLSQRLAGLDEAAQHALVLDVVRRHVAAVLGHDSADQVDPEKAFKDYGFDSLTAVELRNRLNTASGLRLPATLVFDYPTVAAISGYLRAELAPVELTPAEAVLAELDKLQSALTGLAADGPAGEAITRRLRSLVAGWDDGRGEATAAVATQIQESSAEEIFDFIDRELGRI
jgi:polyketide synthase 12